MKRYLLALLLGSALGGLYGAVSAAMNQNPYYPGPGQFGIPEDQLADAWHWRPSVLWLPSWLAAKAPNGGIGIEYTRSGYLFRNEAGKVIFYVASILIGMCLGAAVGAIVRRLWTGDASRSESRRTEHVS